MKRRFYLQNELGQQIDMNDLNNSCLLTSPQNLGCSYASNFDQIGNTFIESNRKIEQKNPTGILNFKTYDKCKEIIDFIEKAEKLKWVYILPYTTGSKTYFRDVSLKSLDKSEKSIAKLACPIEFNGLSLWYEENITTYTISAENNELRWDFKWDSRFVDYDVRRLQFINKGHTEAPIAVEIDGHVINPKISLYVEGQLAQQVSINVEIAEYEKLLYGTKEGNFYINRQKTDGTLEDLFNLDSINPANDNVLRLPKNKSCELRLTADNEILNAQVTIFVYYVAV